MVRLEGLGLDYPGPSGPVRALEGVDAAIPEGAIAAFIGPSGCGKTSLARIVAGLERPSGGRATVGGEEVAGPRRGTAMIFQDYGLLPWKTVSANVELPMLLAGEPSRERKLRSGAVLEELSLSGFASFYPARLSGGMRQRVALARALMQDPDLLVMDEPFSSLDELTRESMQELLLDLRRRRGTTVLIVTHSIEEAAYLADEVYVMRGRNPGRLAARVAVGRGEAEAPTGSARRGPSFRRGEACFAAASAIRRALEAAP
jgi:NitT/TauT family transport system ATP-binding protein